MHIEWLSKVSNWREIRLIFLLNHTSFFEYIYGGTLPNSLLWGFSRRLSFCAAQETMKKPIYGRFLRLLAPEVIGITRKRDGSWADYLSSIKKDSLMIFCPEGRMKRPDGLDKHGQPMTVRAGSIEILEAFQGSKLLLAYSAGLHHIQPPGKLLPKLFKQIKIAIEVIDIDDYLSKFSHLPIEEYRHAICKDLERRRDQFCPLLGPAIS